MENHHPQNVNQLPFSAMFNSKMLVYQRLNLIKSHETTIFPWFPHGFPMVFPWFSYKFTRGCRQILHLRDALAALQRCDELPRGWPVDLLSGDINHILSIDHP